MTDDVERLSACFATLCAEGIVAHHELVERGGDEPPVLIQDLRELLPRHGVAVRGHLTYRARDLVAARASGELPLQLWERSNALSQEEHAVGLRALEVLREAGFEATWEHEALDAAAHFAQNSAVWGEQPPLLLRGLALGELPCEAERGLPWTLRQFGLSLEDFRPAQQTEPPDERVPVDYRYDAAYVLGPAARPVAAVLTLITSSVGEARTLVSVEWPDPADGEPEAGQVLATVRDALLPDVSLRWLDATTLEVGLEDWGWPREVDAADLLGVDAPPIHVRYTD